MEDKLEHNERLRLECLAQAIAMGRHTASRDEIINTAADFEEYVKNGKRS